MKEGNVCCNAIASGHFNLSTLNVKSVTGGWWMVFSFLETFNFEL
jgi:hypothetical protein